MVCQNRPYTTILWLWLTTLSITDEDSLNVGLEPSIMEIEIVAGLKWSTRKRRCVCILRYQIFFFEIDSSLMVLLRKKCMP